MIASVRLCLEGSDRSEVGIVSSNEFHSRIRSLVPLRFHSAVFFRRNWGKWKCLGATNAYPPTHPPTFALLIYFCLSNFLPPSRLTDSVNTMQQLQHSVGADRQALTQRGILSSPSRNQLLLRQKCSFHKQLRSANASKYSFGNCVGLSAPVTILSFHDILLSRYCPILSEVRSPSHPSVHSSVHPPFIFHESVAHSSFLFHLFHPILRHYSAFSQLPKRPPPPL